MDATKNALTFGLADLQRAAQSKAGRFLWHFLQMAIAMELGMMVYHKLLAPILEQTPYGPWTDAYPILGYWGMVSSMVLGMLALMVYQKATGRHCLEMSLAMVAPIAALTVLVLCSVIPSHILYATGDPLMYVAMVIYMLYRPHNHAHGAQEMACH